MGFKPKLSRALGRDGLARLFETRHDETIERVPHFAPGQLRQGMSGVERNWPRRELEPQVNRGAAPRQWRRNQKLVVAEAAIGCLQDMLRRPEFQTVTGIGEDASVRARQVPHPSRLPLRVLI